MTFRVVGHVDAIDVLLRHSIELTDGTCSLSAAAARAGGPSAPGHPSGTRAVGDRVLLEVDAARASLRSAGRARRSVRARGRRRRRPSRRRRSSSARARSSRMAAASVATSASSRSVESANGEQTRRPEDLVRVRPPDARERALVAEERVELAPLAAEDGCEPRRRPRRAPPARGGRARRRAAPASAARRRPASSSRPPSGRARRRRRSPTRNIGFAGPLFPPGRSGAARRSSGARGGRARRRRWGRGGSSRGAGPRRSERPSRALGGGSNVFSVATCARTRVLDRRARDERIELAHPRLDLGQLGHVSSLRRRNRPRTGGGTRVRLGSAPCSRSSSR